MKDIIPFKLFSLRQRLIFKADFFASREEHLSDLYHYSLIVAMYNIFRRNQKGNVYDRRKKRKNYKNRI